MSSIDPATMAQQLASIDIMPFEQRYQRQTNEFQAQLTAWGKIETALRDFQSAVEAMNKSDSGIIQNKASISQEGYLSSTVGSNALSGNYQVFVEQLATAHQLSTGMPSTLDSTTEIPTTGTLDFSVNGKTMSIDLSTIQSSGSGAPTMNDLVSAINNDASNPGVNATLVRSNGQTHLMLSSTETGKANQVNVSASGTGEAWFEDAFTNTSNITEPKDAVIWLGAKDTGLKLENSSNTFSNVIEGVDLTITKAQTATEQPLTLTIGTDNEATVAQVNSFIDAYNALVTAIDSNSQIGDSGTERGPLAGDATLRSIENQLSNLLRSDYGGTRLTQVGIEIDRNGKLSLDSNAFEEAQKSMGSKLESMFNGEGNLLDQIESMTDPYLSYSSGILKGRKDTLNNSISRVDDKTAALDIRYQMTYDRYLKQFTQMNTIMNQMNQTMGLFGANS